MKPIFYFAKRIRSFAGNILYINLAAMLIISLFDGAGIFLLIPLIGLTGILDVSTSEVPLLTWINSLFKDIPQSISLIIILILYILLITVQSYFQKKQLILNAKIHQGFIRHLREETYSALLYSNWDFYLKKKKTDIINLMTNEIGRVSAGTNLFLQFVASIVFTLIQIGIAFWLSAKMTIFVLLFGLALIICSKTFIKKSNEIGKDSFLYSKMYLGGITDHLNGIKEIKSNNLEQSHLMWISSISKKIEYNMIEMISLRTTSQFIYKVVSALLISIFIFFSIKMFQSQSAQLMLIIIIFSRLWPRFTSIQSNLEQLGSIIPSFKALIDLQNECFHAKEIIPKEVENSSPFIIKEGIECKNIYFRYSQKKHIYALQNISLQVPSNKMTAIVGPSGAGKSTLIDLLMGLNKPESGEVFVDRDPLNDENLFSLRKAISYVPQDPFLFNATLRENLLLIEPRATEEEIWESLEFSSAAEFVKKLPQGLDTLIGDRGIRLSGGERQRIVLARAILRKPSILVLDEATSALDTENERKIQRAIEQLKGKMTVIVIAHRLSTIRNADQVIVLDKGKIIQRGEFNQLANEEKGMFSHLLQNQSQVSLIN